MAILRSREFPREHVIVTLCPRDRLRVFLSTIPASEVSVYPVEHSAPTQMILEGIVTTLDPADRVNVAPMGPIVDPEMETLRLRPFKTSTTYQNLRARPYGVFHVTDDVLVLARAAIGALTEAPPLFPAEKIPGRVLADACRWYEFEIVAVDDSQDRTELQARIVHCGRIRDFFGFNRAKHAVLEAAILATRVHMLARSDILAQFAALEIPVRKTAGPRELEAFELLRQYIAVHPAGQTED